MRNHERLPGHGTRGAFAGGPGDGPAFDRDGDGGALPGGTTTPVIDDASRRLLSQHPSLGGTIRNCAGGTTPWGSWLTCEEDVTRAGAY